MQQDGPLSSPSEYYEQGVEYFHQGAYHQAATSFKNAISLLPPKSEFIDIAELYAYLGRTCQALGEYQQALANFDAAKSQSAQINDYRLEAQICRWKGDMQLEIRRYADAIESYKESIQLSSALDDIATRAVTDLQLAKALVFSGKLDQATALYGESLSVLQSAGKRNELAEALGGMGDVYRRQVRYAEAANSLSQALATLGPDDDPVLQAKLKLTLGLVHSEQGDPNGAIVEFRDGVNILRKTQSDRGLEALLLFYLGTVYEHNGRLLDARKYFSDALEINRSLGDKIAEDYLYLFVIRCNLQLMTPDQRSQALDRLLQSYQSIATKFHDCGHATGEAYTYTLIGSIYESEENPTQAEAMYQKAVDIDLENRGEYLSAESHLPLLKALGIDNDHTAWYYKLASTLVRLNRPYDAVGILDQCQMKRYVKVFEHLRVSIRHPALKDLVQDCRSKLDQMNLLQFELTNWLSGKQKYLDNRAVNSLESQIVNLRKTIRDEAVRIVSVQPNYEPLLIPVGKKYQSFEASIPDGATVLQFLPSDKNLVVFAMTRNVLTVQSVPVSRDSIFSMVRDYEQLLQDPAVYAGAAGMASLGSMTLFEKLSAQLYDYFIRPVDSWVDRSLIIIAPPELEGFPFQALERQDSKGNVRYLIEIASVDYLPSLSSLRDGTVNSTDTRTVIACGNPGGQNWAVDYELRDIRSFFKNAQIMLGVDATWNSLAQSSGDVLQLSTDFVNTTDPEDLGSFICSSGKTIGETEPVPFEQLATHPPFPVVELSNQQLKGAGLTPMQALLLRVNGTSDVFFNAWIADRKVSKFFSEYFYTNLAAGLAPGDAYRQALLNLIGTREVSHPRSWGQFFHFGIG